MRVRLLVAALLVGVALVTAACMGDGALEVQATFDDVVDLTTRGHVKIADVPVGIISRIEGTPDHRALVTMTIDPEIELPARVTARLRKTNVLGERFVELVPDREAGGTFDPGVVITETEIVPELEELVEASTDLLVAITADRLAAALEAGATGLGDRGHTFGGLLDDLTQIVSTYEQNSRDLVRLIDGLEAFLAEVGPEAELHGRAFEELARAATVLSEEDDRLLDTLTDVRRLSLTGTDIIRTHRTRIDDFFTRFTAVTDEVVRREQDLDRLFFELSKHNFNTIRGVNAEHAQVILDFIVCGENETPGDRVRGCDDPPQGRPRPEPRPPQGGWLGGAQ